MKKLALFLALAIFLAGGAVAVMPGLSQAQAYQYPPPPSNLYANPWVGTNTPWVYYNGDWFLNGVLFYNFGSQRGWCPYYAYSSTNIVRSSQWYGAKWNSWYAGHPHYWDHFHRNYPYWRDHHEGYRYDRKFYDQHHHGQGAGWHKGYKPEHYHRGDKPEPHHKGDRPEPHHKGDRPDPHHKGYKPDHHREDPHEKHKGEHGRDHREKGKERHGEHREHEHHEQHHEHHEHGRK